MEQPTHSLVIPVYGNADTITALVQAVEHIAEQVHEPLETIFVVDGSPDDSRERLLAELSASRTTARVVDHSRNFGSFAAIRTGMRLARGRYVAVMAADLQEPPELVIGFLRRLATGEVDVVAGQRMSRDDRGDEAAKLYWRLYRRFVMRDIPAGGVDVFACTAAVRDVVCSMEEVHTSLVGQLFWVGFRRETVPYDRLPRAGESGWTLSRKLRYLSDSVFAFTDLPVRILWVSGLIGMLFAVAVGLVVIAARATGTIHVPGYAATVLILLLFLSLNSVGLGIIGSYVWRAYETVKGRPGAIVRDVIEMPKGATVTEAFIHPQALCESPDIGRGTKVWAFAHILPGARIGDDCNICDGVFIEGDVIVGNRVTVKCGVQLWNGLVIGDDVFIGPNATFTNDLHPQSRRWLSQPMRTVVHGEASIGANATILPGIEIGRGAMIGAGAVVTRSVPPHAVVVGNPARITGYSDSPRAEAAPPVAGQTGSRTALGVSGVYVTRAPEFSDLRGRLTAGELPGDAIPFQPERWFLVYGVPSREVRGEHAHRVCEQFLICVSGQVTVAVDDGVHRGEVVLNSPTAGVYIPPLVWASQFHYGPDTVLLVLASHRYDPEDYVREYEQFRQLVA